MVDGCICVTDSGESDSVQCTCVIELCCNCCAEETWLYRHKFHAEYVYLLERTTSIVLASSSCRYSVSSRRDF